MTAETRRFYYWLAIDGLAFVAAVAFVSRALRVGSREEGIAWVALVAFSAADAAWRLGAWNARYAERQAADILRKIYDPKLGDYSVPIVLSPERGERGGRTDGGLNGE